MELESSDPDCLDSQGDDLDLVPCLFFSSLNSSRLLFFFLVTMPRGMWDLP